MTKFRATDAAGRIHTRTTKRTYTHTVVFLPCYAADLAKASQPRQVDGDNWEFAGQMVAWGGVFNGVRKPYHTDEQVSKELASNQERVAQFPDRAAAIEGNRLRRIEDVEARKAAGYYETWQNAGWCGRLDLAQKLAAQTAGARVEILIAEALP